LVDNTPNVTVRKLDFSAMDGDQLWLCIAQVPRVFAKDDADAPNPDGVALVETLLNVVGTHAPLDADCDRSPTALRVLVLPELAFGSTDRARIDAAVAAYNRPLLVIAGVGFPKAGDIRGEIPDFPQTASNSRHVNFGCAWITLPSANGQLTSQRIQYCKNHCEQSVEVPNYDPVEGTHILAIEFNDLVVFPVICADLLQQTEHGRPSVLDRVKAFSLEVSKPALVAGSLLQWKPWHGIWASRIDLAVQSVKGAVVLANIAQDARPSSFKDDLSRNLSGVYTAVMAHKDKQPNNYCAVGIHETARSGVALRDSISVVAAGSLRVRGYTPIDSHIWMPKWANACSTGALIELPKDCLFYELPRISKRTVHQTVPPTLLGKIAKLLTTSDLKGARRFFSSVLHGLERAPVMLDPSESGDINAAAEIGLRAADALLMTEGFRWPDGNSGTLIYEFVEGDDKKVALTTYVWRSATQTWQSMQKRLRAYANDSTAQPGLIVFTADRHSIPVDEDLGERDLTQPRSEALPDVTHARRSVNTVVCLPLHLAAQLSDIVNVDALLQSRAADLRARIAERIRRST
jgi:hypothetical protein